MNTPLLSSILLSSLVSFSTAHADGNAALAPQASIESQPQAEKENSINFSPLGLLFGGYNLNYERLLGGYHGVIVEGSYTRNSVENSLGGGVGYRFHWRGQQDSGFVGVGIDFSTGDSKVAYKDEPASESRTHDLKVMATTITANVGRRWAWDSGLNITLRVGLGSGYYAATTQSKEPGAQGAVKELEDSSTAVDGELSLGYSF